MQCFVSALFALILITTLDAIGVCWCYNVSSQIHSLHANLLPSDNCSLYTGHVAHTAQHSWEAAAQPC